jgi:hypothetical protein
MECQRATTTAQDDSNFPTSPSISIRLRVGDCTGHATFYERREKGTYLISYCGFQHKAFFTAARLTHNSSSN